ncbi:molybdopterin molybdotransferase MoeA [Jannaschia aquimarina]|uniref:Molybdopterin molybdenumtransferase n=1 Tax=Jannaschia aquimarina TaxID=935700 RepID=A0A0D1EH24_9RHOB|nr:molybdopterin molybdotransferase MoeA [Jannaschia aquimarina]KIT16959.1 Molybdopterin molybdenumtransferase [Jannaschia aquimarina]SNT33406.1 molybdopterin molybdotransferase [Jannaschia aquimarina]
MISVQEARDHLIALMPTMPVETVPIAKASGRVLAAPIEARHDQPPFAASAMDGYALAGPVEVGERLTVIGEAAAGHPFDGRLAQGEAVRIFTGAPVPEPADRVLIQEDARGEGNGIEVLDAPREGLHIRPAGGDFGRGDRMAPRRLGFADLALAAAMGHGDLPVRRRPRISILMTGDELRHPGETLPPGGIVASNGYGLLALLSNAGALPRLLPIAPDDPKLLIAALETGLDADLMVTIGGASVGAHDLVAGLGRDGMDLVFHKVRMRPGKPLLAGRWRGTPLIGLPGNPVSALVCGVIFLLPALRASLGLPAEPTMLDLRLATPVRENGPREHYMRGRLVSGAVEVFDRQDSSLLSVLADADVLVIRPPNDPARSIGDVVAAIALPSVNRF